LSPAWKLKAPSEIRVREWDDEFVVYDGHTASTHLLGPAAAAILLTLLEAEQALTRADLLENLGIEDPAGSDVAPADGDALVSILNELEQIELIEAKAI